MCVASGEWSTSTGSNPRDSTPSNSRLAGPEQDGDHVAQRLVSLRRDALDERFPGLVDVLRVARRPRVAVKQARRYPTGKSSAPASSA
jgi:hypothetical protein